MEILGLQQQIYNRALYSLGPDVGCYAPPKLYENELNESLQVTIQSLYTLYSVVVKLYENELN